MKYWLEISLGVVALAILVLVLHVRSTGSGLPAPAALQVSALLPGTPTHFIDSLTYGGVAVTLPSGQQRQIVVRRGDSVSVQGWVTDSPHQAAASRVAAQIDDVSRLTLDSLYERPDVAKALDNPAYLHSGFLIAIPAQLLPVGKHVVRLLVGDAAQTGFYLLPETLTVDVVARPVPTHS